MASSSTSDIRRTSRQKKPSLKALESIYLSKLENSGFVHSVDSDEDICITETYGKEVERDKPKLLHNNDVVHGEEIFKFRKQKRQGLAQKVAEVHSQTPSQTEHRRTKSKIEKLISIDTSGSEYEVSSESSSTSDESTIDSSNEESDSNNTKTKNPLLRCNIKNSNVKLKPTVARCKGKYTINADEYFSNCTSNKIRTSNNTLDKLETPRLPQYQLQKLLQNIKLSSEHQTSIGYLAQVYESSFKKWMYLLNENFNILVYGLGSKRIILNEFQMKYLNNFPVIVVNGFFPTLSVKNILDSIIVDILELEDNPSNINEACNLILQELKNIDTHLYLIINNIESELIRNIKAQGILARLAAAKNIHVIASIDHINAPLIWDHNKLNKFTFVWWDVTSFTPYIEETSFERSMMVKQSNSLALSSLRNVFLSLTSNSKNIFTIITKYQLENAKNQYYQGLAFKDLYMSCREAFIVSSDLALRAQLTEFIDHKMVKLKRSVDGTEYLVIPLPRDLLQKFLEENA